MAIRTEWFQSAADASDDPEVDPFQAKAAPVVQGAAIADLPMRPISLATPVPELVQRLDILVAREARLFDAGVECAIKDQPDMSCLACPFSKAEVENHRKCGLCRIGREQEVTGTYLIAQRARSGGG